MSSLDALEEGPSRLVVRVLIDKASLEGPAEDRLVKAIRVGQVLSDGYLQPADHRPGFVKCRGDAALFMLGRKR